jgi:hypothetical protein
MVESFNSTSARADGGSAAVGLSGKVIVVTGGSRGLGAATARVLFRDGPVPQTGDEPPFLALINAWIELTGVMNELSRSMGERDFYPFVLSDSAVTKLHFVHRVMHEAGRNDGAAR